MLTPLTAFLEPNFLHILFMRDLITARKLTYCAQIIRMMLFALLSVLQKLAGRGVKYMFCTVAVDHSCYELRYQIDDGSLYIFNFT